MGFMYEWLSGLFGTPLSDYLWGYDCLTDSYNNAQVYTGIGIVTLLVVALSIALLYFIVDHPRWASRKLPWLLWGLATCIINGVIGASWTLALLNNGAIGDCHNVLGINCVMFGIANFIDTAILFVTLSFVCKRFSAVNKHTPWKSKFLVRK